MKILFFLIFTLHMAYSQSHRPRESGIIIGVLKPGILNGITDVKGVKVGHTTIIEGKHIRTGATAILPHEDNLYQHKVPAAIYVHNGYGKLAGLSQVVELGNIETPIILTNTLSVSGAMDALIEYTLTQDGNENVRSVNAIVGETNDGYLNDIRGRHITTDQILSAIDSAINGPVEEGNVGAGTGTVCFGWKGGIGTASRIIPTSLGGYTVGVLVQTNFGGVLEINGIPVGEELGQYYLKDAIEAQADGSCMIVVATDAPLSSRNLERLAKRAMMGLAKTGGIASNGSGDYVIAFSTDESIRVNEESQLKTVTVLNNNALSPLFMAVIEATEEAIINSLWAAETMSGRDNHIIEALPKGRVLEILKKYNALESIDK